jgi:hypothetical protein
MKAAYSIALAGLAMVVAGCATSSQVQEMIDASHRDYLTQAESHDASIEVLKKSAMTGLEKSQENSETLVALQARMDEAITQQKTIQGYAEASKVMSAANTVKVAELEEELRTNAESDAESQERLTTIDKLYESVMIAHYQMIADSANAAIESLKADGMAANTNAPVNLDEPIEIVAPDTTSPPATNAPTAVPAE